MTQADVQRNAVVAWMAKHDGDFGYTNDYRRKDPERYGWGDCSSTIAQAYRQCAGIEIGERSFNIASDPDAYTVASATSWRDLPLSDLKPADIICMGWHSGAFAGRISHVHRPTEVPSAQHKSRRAHAADQPLLSADKGLPRVSAGYDGNTTGERHRTGEQEQ